MMGSASECHLHKAKHRTRKQLYNFTMTMMMMRLVALVALVVAASGFSPAPPRISITTSVGLRMSEEPAAEEAAAEPVKCPDCDMCDGSGR